MVDKEFKIAKVSGRIYKDAVYQKLLPSKKAQETPEKEEEIKKTPSPEPPKTPEPPKPSESAQNLDETDMRIIRFLMLDSRTTLSAMAKEMGIGTSTVYKRLSRLVSEGVIRKFTILADGNKLGLGSAAYVGLKIGKTEKENVKKRLLEIPQIVEIHEVLEPYDLFIKIRSTDIKTLKEGPLNILEGIEGIEEIKSILVVNTIKENIYNV